MAGYTLLQFRTYLEDAQRSELRGMHDRLMAAWWTAALQQGDRKVADQFKMLVEKVSNAAK